MIIHPLRFARRPCLRGTVSYCLLMQNKMAPRNVMPSLFLYAPPKKGGATVSTVYSLFSLLYFRICLILPGKEGIFCHHGIHFCANAGDVFLVFRVVEHALDERGDNGHHVLLDTTGGDGRCAKAYA